MHQLLCFLKPHCIIGENKMRSLNYLARGIPWNIVFLFAPWTIQLTSNDNIFCNEFIILSHFIHSPTLLNFLILDSQCQDNSTKISSTFPVARHPSLFNIVCLFFFCFLDKKKKKLLNLIRLDVQRGIQVQLEWVVSLGMKMLAASLAFISLLDELIVLFQSSGFSGLAYY